MELWRAFDRIRDALLKQEEMRTRSGAEFSAWVEKARPAFQEYVDIVTADEDAHYGATYCSWLDWLDARKLAWRGRLQWDIPTKGPLIFTPPSSEELTTRIAAILGELDLVDVTRRLARSSSGPSAETRGARGRKRERGLTVHRSQ